jgi:pyruvate carboxylase
MHTVAIYSYEDRMSAHRQKVRGVACIIERLESELTNIY